MRRTLEGPGAKSDGHEPPRFVDELVPGLEGDLDDVLVGLEDAVGEVRLAQKPLEALDRVQL